MTDYLPGTAGPATRPRLLCFHHAGAAASTFTPWRDALGVEVLPVQLPGREHRIDEPRLREMRTLVDELDEQLAPWLAEPHIFYGHSMGAAVAYALTRQRMAAGRSLPRLLVVGGFPAPHRPAKVHKYARMSDSELAEWMIGIGGMSPVLLNYPDWLTAATSLIRDDMVLCASAWPRDPVPLPCPIEVFTGAGDTLMSATDAEEWDRHTMSHCTVHTVAGGHLFLRDADFLAQLADVLTGVESSL